MVSSERGSPVEHVLWERAVGSHCLRGGGCAACMGGELPGALHAHQLMSVTGPNRRTCGQSTQPNLMALQ